MFTTQLVNRPSVHDYAGACKGWHFLLLPFIPLLVNYETLGLHTIEHMPTCTCPIQDCLVVKAPVPAAWG
jgi:hypothetical protein